jgi:GTP-binding protein Era
VGKSTLINAVMGRKVSIVTSKPLHRNAGKAMNKLMNRTAANALADADVILFVTDATRWTTEDDDVLHRLKTARAPIVAVLNKVDRVHPREALLDTLALMSARHDFAEIVPVSALKHDNLDALIALLPPFLPESPPLFPEDMHTDRSREFHAAEVVREKLTLMLHQELPYGLTVQVERYLEEEKGITINAIIWVERDSQKGIVVGKNGSTLKRVGRAARLELKDQLQKSVHLELWVKVKSNWADNEKDLMNLGFETP